MLDDGQERYLAKKRVNDDINKNFKKSVKDKHNQITNQTASKVMNKFDEITAKREAAHLRKIDQ